MSKSDTKARAALIRTKHNPHDSKVFIHAACALNALCIRFGHSWVRRALWAAPDR